MFINRSVAETKGEADGESVTREAEPRADVDSPNHRQQAAIANNCDFGLEPSSVIQTVPFAFLRLFVMTASRVSRSIWGGGNCVEGSKRGQGRLNLARRL